MGFKDSFRDYLHTSLFDWKVTAVLMLVGIGSYTVYSCGKRDVVDVEQPTPASSDGAVNAPAVVCEGGQPVGSTRSALCPSGEIGQKFEVCTLAGTWDAVPGDSCRADSGSGGTACPTVTFADIKPKFDSKCVGCHPQWAGDNYDKVVADFDDIFYRITTPNASEIMPPGGVGLPADERQLYTDWKAGGLAKSPQDCQASNGTISFGDMTAGMIAVAQADIEQQNFGVVHAFGGQTKPLAKTSKLRFAIMGHRLNEGLNANDFKKQWAGLNKSLNAVSLADDVAVCAPLGPSQSVCGINLEDFGWTASDWETLVAQDPLRSVDAHGNLVKGIVDNSTAGRILQGLTGSRQPWIHGDNLAIISQKPKTYYAMRRIPSTLQQYLANLGVDLKRKIAENDVVMIGTDKSPIGLGKHRGVMFFDISNTEYCSITFDPNDAQENIIENPFINLFNPGLGPRDFNYVASETICHLDTGQEYALWAADGLRQDEAPINVVRDTENPFEPSPIIVSSESCLGCHGNDAVASNFLPFSNEVGDVYCKGNGDLNAQDLAIVREQYCNTTKLTGIVTSHNKKQGAINALLGHKPGDGNVYKALTYPFKGGRDLRNVAAFFGISQDDLALCINSSNELRGQIGTLASGGTITEGTFLRAAPLTIRDCELLQD